jgi:hypothetical protein
MEEIIPSKVKAGIPNTQFSLQFKLSHGHRLKKIIEVIVKIPLGIAEKVHL